MEKHDNYAVASANARKLFLSYDQDALIRKLNLPCDDAWLYTRFFDRDYRISRLTGNMERLEGAAWQSANGFHEVLTLMDLLCDSREDRHLSGRIRNMLDFGHQFHQTLLEESRDPFAEKIQENPAAFAAACGQMGGKERKGADAGFDIPVFQELSVTLLFWEGDEEFAPRLRFLWDENALQYLKYETMYYAVGYLKERLEKKMG